MASENAKIDQNSRWTLTAITNDANEEIRNARVNPITGALVVEATVTSTNTSIGSTIPGGTAGSILFLGSGSTLAQDNANLFYDDTNNFVGLGNNTPTATLHITGTFRYQDGSETNGYVLTCDANGNATWQIAAGNAGYDLIQNAGVSVTQRTTINLTSLLTATDVGAKTQLDINVVNLANNSTFLSTIEGNLLTDATFITNLGNALISDATFITNLESTLVADATFITNLGIALTNDATFQTNIVNIVNNPATNPDAGKVFVNNVDTTLGFLADKLIAGTGITLTPSGAGNETLTVTATGGGGSGTDLSFNINQTAHGLSVGDVIKSNGTDNQFAKAQANNAVNSEAVGIVTVVTDADNFTYASSAIQLSGGFVPVGTPGSAVFLDPVVAGGMTLTKPTTVGEIIRGLGTIVASGATMYFDIAALAEEITAPSTGDSSEFKVGVGSSSNVNWFNIQYPFLPATLADNQRVWDNFSNSGVQLFVNPSVYFPSSQTLFFSKANGTMTGILPDLVNADNYKFNTQKQAIFSCQANVVPAGGGVQCGIGFMEMVALGDDAFPNLQGLNKMSVGFIRNSAGQWFARCANGSAFTETAITIADGVHTFRCEYDPANVTPQARFFVDGVLLSTVTTTLPTAQANVVGFSGGNGTPDLGIDTITCPSFAVEI